MRYVFACLVLSGSVLASGQAPSGTSSSSASQTSRLLPEFSAEERAVLGADALLDRVKALQARADGGAKEQLEVLNLRQQALERVMAASFAIDDALGRIDTEAAYASEDRYVLQLHAQREANALNVLTFAASGALGAAGSAMQLTRGLNHAGTAFQAAAGGTSLVLSAAQFRMKGGRQPVRSPYNMLAEILDRTPNAESHYPALVAAYLRAARPDGKPPVGEGLVAAWRRLHRLKDGAGKEAKGGDGATVEVLTADRDSSAKLSAEELADREAMLHDLHANLVLLRSELQQELMAVESSH